MTLFHILVFILTTLLVRWFCPRHWRGWFFLLGSILAAFWLQTSSPIRNLDYWLPVASISLTVFTWAILNPAGTSNQASWFPGIIAITLALVAIGLLRYIPGLCCLTPSRPPQLIQIFLVVAAILVIFTLLYRAKSGRDRFPTVAIIFLIIVFVVLKSPALAGLASSGLRDIQGQSTDLATAADLAWLGFSYLAFRLIHALRDFQGKRLPTASLQEFSLYTLFYPAFTAGPIDRIQRFLPDLRNASENGSVAQSRFAPDPQAIEDTIRGSQRIFFGVFKKFVLADSLALISLNNQNASQTASGIWMWVLLYAYAFRLYFDFAGYTDIAIGLGRLAGIRLPENFDRPYLKPNITAFWNSWHMTLAQWFRAYFFNPLTRFLRTQYRLIPVWIVIFVGQLSTMILIGLWHGIAWGFFAWGIWHGVGLFVHSRWSDWIRSLPQAPNYSPFASRIFDWIGTLTTFHFVLLGWVWFSMPDPRNAVDVFRKLFGL